MNTTDFLMISSAICPDRTLMIFEDNRLTFAQVAERTNRLANAFSEMGLKKDDRVGILQVNCSQFIETYFAVAKLGAIFVPLNFRAKSDELIYMLNNSKAKILLIGSRYMDMVDQMLPELSSVEKCISIDEKIEGKLFYDDIIKSASPDDVFTEIGDDDVTVLMYTAGTTGRPKGVPLRHSGFSSYMLENVQPADPDIAESNLLTVPLYHVAGVQAMMAAVYGGRTLALMSQFDVKEWMQTVEKEQITRAMLVPTMLKRVVDDPDFEKYNLTSLQILTYGAAPMPFEVIEKAIRIMPWTRFINAFGQTETASTITMLGPEDHIIEGTEEEQQKRLNRLKSSIGKPLADVEVKIVDPDGNEVPRGEIGEIIAKGPRIMSGYWGDKEKTDQVLTSDGWLRTSDKGWMDEDEYIFLAGRDDDLIIRGGENISPGEVENAITSIDKVEEAAVIAVPDPEWGQEPRAIVVLKKGETATEEEIIEHCRNKLASYKKPRSIIFIDTLPRNQMGKVLKKDLRKQYGQP